MRRQNQGREVLPGMRRGPEREERLPGMRTRGRGQSEVLPGMRTEILMRKLLAVALLLCVNCGTIIHQTTQTIPVTSDPPGADVKVACGDVENPPNLVTPVKVEVHRKP